MSSLVLISSQNTVMPTSAPTGTYVSPPSPPLRYTAFDELSTGLQQTLIDVFGYTAETWNVPGSAEIEDTAFADLDPAVQTAVTTTPPDGLGLTEEVWNCHVNHYAGFSWSDLNVVVGVRRHWVALGWTAAGWAGVSDGPATETTSWSNLTSSERAAAVSLCYFDELWDGTLDLDAFVSAAPTAEPTPESSRAAPATSPTTSDGEMTFGPRNGVIVASLGFWWCAFT